MISRLRLTVAAVGATAALAACSSAETPTAAQPSTEPSAPPSASAPASPSPSIGATPATSTRGSSTATPDRPAYCGAIEAVDTANKTVTFAALKSYNAAEDTPNPTGARDASGTYTVPVSPDLVVTDRVESAGGEDPGTRKILGKEVPLMQRLAPVLSAIGGEARPYLYLTDGKLRSIVLVTEPTKGPAGTECYSGDGS